MTEKEADKLKWQFLIYDRDGSGELKNLLQSQDMDKSVSFFTFLDFAYFFKDR